MSDSPHRRDNRPAMHREMYETTIPFGEPELARASAYGRYIDELPARLPTGEPVDARISTLSASLRADLMRYTVSGGSFEAVEVLAACVRHAKRVTVHLQCGERVVPLTVFAFEHLVHCPMDMHELVTRHVPTLRVLNVEPALLRPPGDPVQALVADLHEHHPLPNLLWEVAMRGPRRELLPEIAGAAMYRVAPNIDIDALPTGGALLFGMRRLQGERYSLRELAEFPGFDRERAVRLLNALYLQAGLIVSRSVRHGFGDSRWRR
jgi:hypothetical protein